MINFKNILTTFCVITFSNSLISQGNTKLAQADLLFNQYSYAKAINAYKGLKDKDNVHVKRQISEAYFKTMNYDSASVWFKKVIDSKQANAVDYYHYSEVLTAYSATSI